MTNEFWHNKRVLVTGGNGFLGRFIVRKLHDRGATVFVADLDRYDLRHLDDIRRALSDAKPQMVIHLAARVAVVVHLAWVDSRHNFCEQEARLLCNWS